MEEKKDVKVVIGSPHLNKVEIVDSGRKGLKTVYSISTTIDGVLSVKDRKEREKRPVHRELREAFVGLKSHLLKMCGYYWPNDKLLEMLSKDTEVTYVQVNDKGQFRVGGYKRVFGSYDIAISGPLMSASDYDEGLYEGFEKLVAIIKAESELFMNGTRRAEVKQLVYDFLVVKRDIANPEVAYENMSAEEVEAITKEVMEESGLDVIMEDGHSVVVPREDKVPVNHLQDIIKGEMEVVLDEHPGAEIQEPVFIDTNVSEVEMEHIDGVDEMFPDFKEE